MNHTTYLLFNLVCSIKPRLLRMSKMVKISTISEFKLTTEYEDAFDDCVEFKEHYRVLKTTLLISNEKTIVVIELLIEDANNGQNHSFDDTITRERFYDRLKLSISDFLSEGFAINPETKIVFADLLAIRIMDCSCKCLGIDPILRKCIIDVHRNSIVHDSFIARKYEYENYGNTKILHRFRFGMQHQMEFYIAINDNDLNDATVFKARNPVSEFNIIYNTSQLKIPLKYYINWYLGINESEYLKYAIDNFSKYSLEPDGEGPSAFANGDSWTILLCYTKEDTK